MQGDRMGKYECATCDDFFYLSDSLAFDGFYPAAFTEYEEHPVYWRGNA